MKKALLIIGCIILAVAVLIGGFNVVYAIQCNTVNNKEKAAEAACYYDEDFSDVKYFNFLKSEFNGYRYYDYFDVCTSDGERYIVELKITEDDEYELSGRSTYTNFIYRYIILNDMIKYRSSDAGTLSDRIDDNIDDLYGLTK